MDVRHLKYWWAVLNNTSRSALIHDFLPSQTLPWINYSRIDYSLAPLAGQAFKSLLFLQPDSWDWADVDWKYPTFSTQSPYMCWVLLFYKALLCEIFCGVSSQLAWSGLSQCCGHGAIQPAFLVIPCSNLEHVHRNTWKILTRKAVSFGRFTTGDLGQNWPAQDKAELSSSTEGAELKT